VAWWTGDEGLKAMIATPPVEKAKSLAEVRGRLQAAPSFGVQVASTDAGEPFEAIDRTDSRLAALTDFPQASFLASDPRSPKQLFHDLSTRTSGLLVNLRAGGFRRDLSMEFGRPANEVRKDALYTIYNEKGISFEELYAYYKLHEELESVSGNYTTGGSIPSGTMGFKLGATPSACIADKYFHFKMPAVVSLQVIFSIQARPVSSNPGALNRLYLAFDPVVTFWNPLDVPVVIPTTAWMSFNFFQFPYTIEVKAGGQTWECPLIASLSGATETSNRDTNFLGLRMGEIEQIVLKPGEVIKLSQTGDLKVEGNSPNRALQAKAGFNYGGGRDATDAGQVREYHRSQQHCRSQLHHAPERPHRGQELAERSIDDGWQPAYPPLRSPLPPVLRGVGAARRRRHRVWRHVDRLRLWQHPGQAR
jgi:hypothetical protein